MILVTNLLNHIDEAFLRRFQSVIYFPVPDQVMRLELWKKMLPEVWLEGQPEGLFGQITRYELSGGSISNVIRRCALQLLANREKTLRPEILLGAVDKKLHKEKMA